ncbi:MAG TPA: hypothetical protein VK908_09090 [Jiangellales bacterium]|nr:hypothetical protein [Jiangellales bacterium]
MIVVIRAVVGVLVIAHGLVHLLYVAPDVPEFTLKDSWIVPVSVRRSVGIVLIVGTVVAFALVGLAVWGVPGLAGAWPVLTLIASVLSLVLLICFWDVRLVFGVILDLGLIAVALTEPEWMQRVG